MMDSVIKNNYQYTGSTSSNSITQYDIVNATLYSLALTLVATLFNIYLGFTMPNIMYVLFIGAGFGLMGMSLLLFFMKKDTSTIFYTSIHAILQGLTTGGFTYMIGTQTLKDGTPGWSLVGQAIFGSITVFVIAMALYAFGIIKPNERMRNFIKVAVLGFMTLYGVNFLLAVFAGKNFLFSEGPIPIIIAVLAIVLAALSVIKDTQNCDFAISNHMDKRVKWSLASAITANLIWLYIEILRLLYLLRR